MPQRHAGATNEGLPVSRKGGAYVTDENGNQQLVERTQSREEAAATEPPGPTKPKAHTTKKKLASK